jgi:ribose transport system substrate-binding protein
MKNNVGGKMRMKKKTKLFALILAAGMLVSVTACGSNTPAPAPPAETPPAEAPPAEAPASALDKLLAMEDKLPLGGLQPKHLDSRADINKALPLKKGPGEKLIIGFAGASQGSTFFTEMYNSAQQRADKYGYELRYQNANFDLNAQMTQIETFLTQGVDILVVNAVDIDATLSYYHQAVNQGIPVITCGPTAAKADYPTVTTVLSGSFESGYVVGEYIAEKLYPENKVLKVGFVISRAGDADSNSRPCGFVSGYTAKHAELSGNPYPGKWEATLVGYDAWITCRDKGSYTLDGVMDLVGYVAAGATDANSAQKVAADLITAHPEMDLIFVETDSLGPGVLQEVEQHGMVPGKDVYLCCGADAAIYTLDYIKEGKMLAVGTNPPYYTGAGIIDLIHDIQNGYDANNLPANSFTPTYCVNVDNIDQYYDPALQFAPMQDWNVQNIDEYNAAHAND